MENPKKNIRLVSNKNSRVILPNIMTLVGVCIGLTSIKFAFDGRFELSVIAVLIAAIIDGLDGRIARLIKATSKVGKELYRQIWLVNIFNICGLCCLKTCKI